MNSITELLDLEDIDISITDIRIEGRKKILSLETKLEAHFCPCCGFKMYSRGIKRRKISHPVLQDGYELILVLNQRRWRCTNPDCGYVTNDTFRFVNHRRRTTNASDMLIVLAFRNLDDSAVSIARRFKTSDTHVLEVFDKYVKLDRLPLTDILSVDEVHTDMEKDCKYALVLQDFHTGDPIDLLRSRKKDVTEPYFASIPLEERKQVRYLLSDMYNPYISFVDKYFPNAVPVVDSFHVVQWVIHAIDMYIRQLGRKYRQRDKELQEERSAAAGRPVRLPESDEMYMLRKYRWLVLSNRENIVYRTELRMDPHFHRLMNTYDYEAQLFRIDPRLETLRDLKEKYIIFNKEYAGDPMKAATALEDLIDDYFHSGDSIFTDFLSNGPIESLNRKVKDLKRLGRGFRSFEHFRNRFLYAARNNPVLDAVSGSRQVQYFEEEDTL